MRPAALDTLGARRPFSGPTMVLACCGTYGSPGSRGAALGLSSGSLAMASAGVREITSVLTTGGGQVVGGTGNTLRSPRPPRPQSGAIKNDPLTPWKTDPCLALWMKGVFASLRTPKLDFSDYSGCCPIRFL